MKGIRRHGAGWQADVRVTGHPRSIRQFAIDADPADMQTWRKQEHARLRLTVGRASKGTFAADAKRYLALVETMPSVTMRRRDIGLWVEVFATRATSSILSTEIRAQRDRWHRSGPRRVWQKHRDGRRGGAWIDVPGPLAASTVNHRLRALSNLFTVLYPDDPNPARKVPELEEDDGEDRSLPYELIELVLAAMPDRSQGLKGVKRKDHPVSKTKARARMIAYAGVSPAELARLTADRVNLEQGWIDTGKRRKGKGVLTGRRPLTPEGQDALRRFIAAEAFGTFSTSSMLKSVRRACRHVAAVLEQSPHTAPLAAIVRRIRPYDFRHSYVSEVLEKSGDFHATRLLAGHADLRTTLRYGRRAVNPALVAALAKVTAAGGFAAPDNRATPTTD